ncbi:MAG: aldehyde:ferredoxin oxidoreductase, partial [Desulfobacula sp.]|nr:aldehyde:ferredoxin oxidoreductase [Desulfobacula sp.]
MKGFFNRLVIIDVTDQTIDVQEIDDQTLKMYMGGKGMGTHLLLKHNPPGVDPFSPDNHFIIGSGPVTDSMIYGSCRYGIFSKSPLTGFYGESYSGGKIAVPISRTGYDFIILKGSSQKPVWLEISDKAILFHDAEELWGKGTYETEDSVKELCGQKGCGAMVIGPAGENLVRFA